MFWLQSRDFWIFHVHFWIHAGECPEMSSQVLNFQSSSLASTRAWQLGAGGLHLGGHISVKSCHYPDSHNQDPVMHWHSSSLILDHILFLELSQFWLWVTESFTWIGLNNKKNLLPHVTEKYREKMTSVHGLFRTLAPVSLVLWALLSSVC